MRILIVQFADIGDLILSTPALSALREAQPSAHIALLTSAHAAPVVEGLGLVDELITFDRQQFNGSRALLRPRYLRRLLSLRFDVVIYFRHFTLRAGTLKFALMGLRSRRRIGLENGNGWFLTDRIPDAGFGAKHEAQYWLDLVGLLGASSAPRPARVAQGDYALPALAAGAKRVVIHAGSGGYSVARRWAPQAFAAVADALHAQDGAQIVLVGGRGDDTPAVLGAMRSPVLDLTGKTTLPELAAVLRQSDVFIGADSGVMHLAAAAGARVVAIFGPSNHQAWGPWVPPDGSTERAVVMRSAPLCSPCSYVRHEVGLRDGCAAHTCMRMVTPAQVLAAARALMTDEPPPPVPVRPFNPAFARRVTILGIPIDAITFAEWLDLIAQWVRAGDRAYHVCTTNPEFLMIARRDVNFRNILLRADLCVPDGVGLLWAARHVGQPLPERVTGSDGLPLIAERAAREGWSLFLLGAAPGVAEKAAAILSQRYPGLRIAGTYSGSPAPEEEDDIVRRVNTSHADLLFVAFGAPVQDKWIARNLPRLTVHMAMGIGGAFDFVAGVIPRAPLWMRRAGLEWLYRLYLQPSRLGRMMRLPRFVLAVLRGH